MCLMSCGNVLSLFLPHSSGKEVPTASLFLNVRFWEESSINAGVERTCAWLKFFGIYAGHFLRIDDVMEIWSLERVCKPLIEAR